MMIESTCQHTPTFEVSLCHSKHKGGKVKKPDVVVQKARLTFLRGCSQVGQSPVEGAVELLGLLKYDLAILR